MRYPLDGNLVVTGEFKEKAVPGTGLKDASGVSRHVGVDFRATVGTAIKAPADGVVTASYTSASGNQIIEARIDGLLWRFLHLSQRYVTTGQPIKEGQVIAKSGNSGGVAAHLHIDVRNDGTTWNASLNNYYDVRKVIVRKVIADANKQFVLPPIGAKIQLVPKDKRTTFKASTAIQAGVIDVIDNSFVYIVRGHDAKFPNRIIINSASAGGNGVSLALYYLNGAIIPGWRQI